MEQGWLTLLPHHDVIYNSSLPSGNLLCNVQEYQLEEFYSIAYKIRQDIQTERFIKWHYLFEPGQNEIFKAK